MIATIYICSSADQANALRAAWHVEKRCPLPFVFRRYDCAKLDLAPTPETAVVSPDSRQWSDLITHYQLWTVIMLMPFEEFHIIDSDWAIPHEMHRLFFAPHCADYTLSKPEALRLIGCWEHYRMSRT